MRVAIRRLRTALVLFEEHLEPHTTQRFEGELNAWAGCRANA